MVFWHRHNPWMSWISYACTGINARTGIWLSSFTNSPIKRGFSKFLGVSIYPSTSSLYKYSFRFGIEVRTGLFLNGIAFEMKIHASSTLRTENDESEITSWFKSSWSKLWQSWAERSNFQRATPHPLSSIAHNTIRAELLGPNPRHGNLTQTVGSFKDRTLFDTEIE